MIKIFASGSSLLRTPFTRKEDINYFSTKDIKVTSSVDADLIICGTFKKLLSFFGRFGQSKKYLLWTTEPRFSRHFEPCVSYPLLPNFHIMNVYTGIFGDNHFYVPRQLIELEVDKFSEFRNKKVVSLMTYQAGQKWNLFYQGVNLDLCNLRTKIALKGYHQGVLDIYGRGWPNQVSIAQSRDQGWRGKKN